MGENTQNGLININLQPVADVTNNIINKVAGAVGWLVITPHGTQKQMAEAIEVYVEEIRNDDSLPSIVKAAKIRNAKKEIQEYCNMQDVILHAEEFGADYECGDEMLDVDWAMFFFDKAKNVCRDDAKVLWGKILAEECIEPGTIPKQLIHVLSMMNKEEAELFNVVCQFSADRYRSPECYEKMLLIDLNDTTGLVAAKEMNSARMYDLEALGLINIVPTGVNIEGAGEENILALKYHGKMIEVQTQTGIISTGNVVFTRIGTALAETINVRELPVFLDYVIAKYEKENCIVTIK